MRFLAAFLCLLLLPACGNLSYIVKTYHGVKLEKYEVEGRTVRIFDKPAEKKLMITSSVGDAFKYGAAAGSTFWIWQPGKEIAPMRTAAQRWLDDRKRGAVITDGRLLIMPQWEFNYVEKPR